MLSNLVQTLDDTPDYFINGFLDDKDENTISDNELLISLKRWKNSRATRKNRSISFWMHSCLKIMYRNSWFYKQLKTYSLWHFLQM